MVLILGKSDTPAISTASISLSPTESIQLDEYIKHIFRKLPADETIDSIVKRIVKKEKTLDDY